jgi:hypothetical protein
MIGFPKSGKELRKLGNETFQRPYRFEANEGFHLSNEQIPKRMIEIETPHGGLDPIKDRVVGRGSCIRNGLRLNDELGSK